MADLIRDANPQPPAPPPMRPRPEPPGLWPTSTVVSFGSSAGPSVPVSKPTQKPDDEDVVLATERERYIQCLKEVEKAQSEGGPGDHSINRKRICGMGLRSV